MGPATVQLDQFITLLGLGIADYCDELSTHAYNADTFSSLNLARHNLDLMQSALDSAGASGMTIWQTESTQAMVPTYGVYHPRRARRQLMQTLVMEQYGIPREYNNPWYDRSIGFWDFPTFLTNGDHAVNPQVVLQRVLAEETWGKSYTSAFDFGAPADDMLLGNLYTALDGSSVAVLMMESFIPDAEAVFTVTGSASTLTAVDGFGNETTVTVSNGLVAVSLTDVPCYIRLPSGVSLAPYSVNGWGVGGDLVSVDSCSIVSDNPNATPGDTSIITDGLFISHYDGTNPGVYQLATSPFDSTVPATVTFLFDAAKTINRVVIWCGSGWWQRQSAFLDFDIQTSSNGSSWATAKTVTRTDATSFSFVTDDTSIGCLYETYGTEQWIYDESISPVETIGIRLVVRSTSKGGETSEINTTLYGQGWEHQELTIQEFKAFGSQEAVQTSVWEGAPWNWVIVDTHDGKAGRRRQEGGMIEVVGASRNEVLDKIAALEAEYSAEGVPVSPEWGHLFGKTAVARAGLASLGSD
jgi:hypothetical protein